MRSLLAIALLCASSSARADCGISWPFPDAGGVELGCDGHARVGDVDVYGSLKVHAPHYIPDGGQEDLAWFQVIGGQVFSAGSITILGREDGHSYVLPIPYQEACHSDTGPCGIDWPGQDGSPARVTVSADALHPRWVHAVDAYGCLEFGNALVMDDGGWDSTTLPHGFDLRVCRAEDGFLELDGDFKTTPGHEVVSTFGVFSQSFEDERHGRGSWGTKLFDLQQLQPHELDSPPCVVVPGVADVLGSLMLDTVGTLCLCSPLPDAGRAWQSISGTVPGVYGDSTSCPD